MTNTKFRKRALLSSVAMLLVALVALGSATFAWFSTTNEATAGALQAKTAKSSNILLSETGNSGWTNDLTFTLGTSQNTANGASKYMLPVTTKDFTNWYTVEADDYNVGYSTTAYGSALADIKTNGQYVKYTQLFIESVGSDKVIKLTANVTYPSQATMGTTGIDYVRVALVPLATTTNATAIWTGNKVIANDGNDRSNETAGWTAANQSDSSIVNGTLGSAVTLGTATADAIYGYDVYVYYEGTDFDCKDQFAGSDLQVDFSIVGEDPTP